MVIAISFVLVFHGDGNVHVSGNGNSTAVGNDNMISYSTISCKGSCGSTCYSDRSKSNNDSNCK